MKAILVAQEEDLCEANRNCSTEMANIVKRALAKQPETRYQTVRELSDDLKKLKEHHFSMTADRLASEPQISATRKQRRIDEASHYYDRATELKPDHPMITGQKAFFAFRTGRWAEAERLCEQSLRSDPHRRQEIGTLARIAFLHGQTSKALSLYQRLIELGADGLDYLNLGQIQKKSRSLARSDRLLSVERQCQGHHNLETSFVHGHVLT